MIPASNEHLRTPLGTLILRAGLLTEEQIADALREGERTRRRLGEILVQRGLLGPEDLARVLARQTGLPFIKLEDEPFDRHAVRLVAEDTAIRDRVLSYRFEGGLPIVAIADPTDDVAKANLHEALKREFRLTVTTEADLVAAIARAYGREVDRPPQPTLGIGGAPIRTAGTPSTPTAATIPTTPQSDVVGAPAVSPTSPPPTAAPSAPRQDSVPAAPPAPPDAPVPAPSPSPRMEEPSGVTEAPAESRPPTPAEDLQPDAEPSDAVAAQPAPRLPEDGGGVVVPLWDGPLGALFVSSELLTSDQVEDALREAARRGRRLGEVVLERGWIDERTLANCLAGQKNLPFISLKDWVLDREAVRLLPRETALRYGALPIRFEDGGLNVVVADPTNEAAMESIRAAVDVDVRFAVAAPSELGSALETAYGDTPTAPETPAEAEQLQPDAVGTTGSEAAHGTVEGETTGAHGRVEEETTGAPGSAFRVLVRLGQAERVDAGTYPTLAAAQARAKELMRQISEHGPEEWPFVNGRFLRPDAIVSVDIAEIGDGAEQDLG